MNEDPREAYQYQGSIRSNQMTKSNDMGNEPQATMLLRNSSMGSSNTSLQIVNLSLPQQQPRNRIIVSDSKVARPFQHSEFVEEVNKVSKNIQISKQRLYQILQSSSEKKANGRAAEPEPAMLASPAKQAPQQKKTPGATSTPKFTLRKRKSHTQ